MNLALIHDRLYIKTFWEKRIDTQCQNLENEEQRMNKSALKKSFSSVPSLWVSSSTVQMRLRGEWLVRLENRTKHLKNFNDNYIRKVKTETAADET
ncbi:protein FAM240B isoform X2 [Trachinotus anak]